MHDRTINKDRAEMITALRDPMPFHEECPDGTPQEIIIGDAVDKGIGAALGYQKYLDHDVWGIDGAGRKQVNDDARQK